MPNIVCHASSNPDALWEYCPSLPAAVLFTVLFGLTTCTHVVQASIYRKPFAAVLIMGGLWETGGYVARIFAIENQLSSGVYTAQMLLILLAPLWINAYIYMLLGRMVHFFLEPDRDRVFKIRARLITRMFVLFDITAFLIQAVGGTMTGPDVSPSVQQTGLNIYTAGVGVQLFFLVIFTVLAIRFQRKVSRRQSLSTKATNEDPNPESQEDLPPQSNARFHVDSVMSMPDPSLAIPLLRLLYVTMALIILRNIYRLVEFGTGENSPPIKHEWYSYVFDAVPMFSALLVLNIFNPGKMLQGPRSDFSRENRERKRLKKEKKAAKKAEKRERKELKKKEGSGGVDIEALK